MPASQSMRGRHHLQLKRQKQVSGAFNILESLNISRLLDKINMSEREQKLLALLLVAGLIIGVMFGGKFLTERYQRSSAKALAVKSELQNRQLLMKSADVYKSEIDWLEKLKVFDEKSRFRKPSQVAETELQTFARDQAIAAGLEIKKQGVQPADKTGVHFHRAKAEFQVAGSEMSLFRWMDRLNSPRDFRTVTYYRMFPQRKDDTKVDCTVIVELWYVPQSIEELGTEEPGSPTPSSPDVNSIIPGRNI